LGELVRLRAEQSPSLLVYTHLEDDEREVRSISAAALWRRARALAVGLTALPVGARVLLPFDAGLEFAPALIACTLAGVIGVPVPSPVGGGRGLERLLAICADAEVAAVLTTREVAGRAEALRAALPGARWLSTDVADELAEDFAARTDADPRAPAYLQYTSGSTADPKGVVIDHGNLLANCADLNEAYRFEPASVMVYWVPAYHDLGLVYGVVVPLFVGCRAVSMAAAPSSSARSGGCGRSLAIAAPTASRPTSPTTSPCRRRGRRSARGSTSAAGATRSTGPSRSGPSTRSASSPRSRRTGWPRTCCRTRTGCRRRRPS
jgi:acyl-CoA synthetase (AMP-forming)/AMP-acid ligase II